MSKKRQYSVPVFQVIKGDTGMEAKLIRRKSKGKPFDVIYFRIITSGEQEDVTFHAAPEEALEVAWAMIKTVRKFLLEFKPYEIFRSKGSDQPITEDHIWWSNDD